MTGRDAPGKGPMAHRYDFASDNVAGAMPEALESLVAANAGFASGYGADHVTARAAGFFGAGVGIAALPGASGRIDPAALARTLAEPDVSHRQSPAALSLTNATEYGAVYSEAELAALIQ